MNDFKIERKMPPPPSRRNIYPFGQMKPGDSFFAPEEKQKSISHAAYVFGGRQNPQWKFTIRRVDGGCRCWRIK